MTINVPIPSKAVAALKNKHVSIPTAVAAAAQLGKIWFPGWFAAHEEAIKQTQQWCLYYAVFMASTTGAPTPAAGQEQPDPVKLEPAKSPVPPAEPQKQ